METSRLLINYLPPYVQEYREMQQITGTEQPEIDNMWIACRNALADQFVLDATENGVKRWEKIVGIIPKDTETLDERKLNVLARLNLRLPYTLRTLTEMLNVLCGADGYTLKVDENNYLLIIKLALSNEHNFSAVENLIRRVVPANLITKVGMFNTHGILSDFTHGQLSAYTHTEIRKEIL